MNMYRRIFAFLLVCICIFVMPVVVRAESTETESGDVATANAIGDTAEFFMLVGAAAGTGLASLLQPVVSFLGIIVGILATIASAIISWNIF